VISALERAGFVQVSQRGSHLKLRGLRGGQTRTVIVKHPAKRIPDGTVASILRQAGMTRAEFEQLI
jgi:predicted RNA binding protein YcfA (HicA-like mRNA interferase family)